MRRLIFRGRTLDDVIRVVFREIIDRGQLIKPRKGEAREITGVLLEISNPLARLSRTENRGRIFSGLGELCWYLSGSNKADFITFYIKEYKKFVEDGIVYGGYGPRMFRWKGTNQVRGVIRMLRKNPDTRQAVIQLFDARDTIKEHKDVPCTCTLQFMLRSGRLHLLVSMRSNDAYLGLPHDVFCFTMFQEIVARSVNAKLGSYKHVVGSLHIYLRNLDAARRFLKEGWQPTKPIMPPMPSGNPWKSVRQVLDAEHRIRSRHSFDKAKLAGFEPYWADLTRLLQLFAAKKKGDLNRIRRIRDQMSSPQYFSFIDRQLGRRS